MTASSAAASSIDDVLAEVLWVNSITDPSLCIDSLHEAFLKVVFSFPSAASAEEEDAPTTQIRTAAQRERDARRKAELRREMDELLAPVEEASVGSREGVRDDDDESFDDEEAELDEDAAEVNDFMNWIERGARPSATAAQSQRPTVKATELELHKVGLGAAQQSSAMDPLPDRYKEIEIRERRPQLGSKELAGEVYSYKIPLEHEAYWILRQLRLSGQPLAHNTRIAELANTSRGECADAPVIVAITYALQKMVLEHLEPAHLMLYHQSALHPLLFALLEDSPLMESAEHTLPAPSFAYSLVTGRRQRPYMSERYVGFTAQVEDGSIGDGDPLWHRSASSEYAQRKPCFIELGRLLVRILELDCLCHRLEHRRQRLLVALKDDPEARVQDQRAMLEATVFESVVQADIWQSFVELLTNRRSRGSYNRVHALGIEDVFEEYSITGLQYQENLLANAPVNMCPPQQGNLREWANTVGSRVQPAMSGEAILSLFNNAIVEQFSQLPILSKMIFDLFCSEGDLIVSYQWIQRPDEVFSLASFFVEHPQQYLDLVHMERQRTVNLFYVLDETLVRRALNVGQLYHRNQNDEWCREREVAIDILIINLMDSIIPRVKAELSRQAQLHMDWSSVQRFGLLCAQGPYEPTRLCLERFNDASVTWPPQWNVVEALPTEVAATGWGTRPRSRVCAAYRSDKNGVTAFAFIDENGTTVGSTRWNDCDLKTPSGRAADLTQRIKLESLFLQCCPTVIAVGATDPAALDLMRSLQLFTRDRIFPALQVDIPIVWVSPEVARFCSSTDFANAEYSSSATTDSLMRVSIYLARYLQDPLTALCLLFDSKRTALRLCRSGGENISHEHAAELYARLRWELSLWITATGVWLDDLVKRPNAAAMLQFVAGLGDAKARVLMQKLLPVVPNSRADMQMLLEGVFGPCVAQNAVSSIRIRAPDWSTVDAECSWHPLDHTLIPLDWYEIASFAAAEALRTSGGPQGEGALPIVQLANKLPIEKRRLIDERADQQSLIKKIADLNRAEWLSLRGERELELILEELVAMGHSSLRRPYRRISTRELMTCMTSMVYLTAEESAVQSLARTSATGGTSIVREGEYVEGTVSDVFAGKSPGIRVSTSRGLNAFIRPSDIPDEMTRQTLLDYVKLLLLQREARKLGQSVADRPRAPQWLQRGANIQGVVTGCNWGKCELFLRWCRPREAESEGASPSGAANILSYAALVREAASSSANSLKTAEIENEATVFTTKISRHPLFRDVPNTKANELLRDKEIGEVLLRPARRRRHHAVCVVKVGLNCTCNWIISEERRSNGTLYYRLEDRLLGRTVEYEEVDEFLRNFIAPMIAKVMTIRQHRRFQENEEDVTTSLAEQEQSGNGFAYCFTETSRNSLPPLYRVITRGGGFRHKFDLHISDTAIYVRLPIRGEDDTASFDWVECRNAEHVSEVLKCKAMQDR